MIDLIEVWPDTIDFPLHTKFIKENRHRFEKVIIVWMKTNWSFPIIRDDIQEELKDFKITFLENDVVLGGDDWRNIATNKALGESHAEWIWFTEQDFTTYDPFWVVVDEYLKNFPLFGVSQQGRLHPCCWFIKRELIDRTSKDFSAKPPDHDHFGQIQKDLMDWKEPLTYAEIPKELYYHMNGLTHNLFLVKSGKEPVYKPEEFEQYMKHIEEHEQKL